MANNKHFSKWVACWGNATSIADQQPAMYAKDITLRYPVKMCFDGSRLRLRFSNFTGTEPVTLSTVTAARALENDMNIDAATLHALTFNNGMSSVTIQPGQEITCDEFDYEVTAGETLNVSIYFENFTQMNSGVSVSGPLSKGYYSYGNFASDAVLPIKLTRGTNWFYFINTIDIFTAEENHAVICYGDSITAQSWPEHLVLFAKEEGINNVSIIRRAVSGTRILREYDNITYAAYGRKGETRFPLEMNVAGADTVIIHHGINDIIHPVGVDVNPFRPWEDLPTVEELIEGVRNFYLPIAREKNKNVYSATLLPIYGWRTYADFREELVSGFNKWLRTSDEFDGCVDFAAVVCDPENRFALESSCDSGDHLHPSEKGHKLRAREALKIL